MFALALALVLVAPQSPQIPNGLEPAMDQHIRNIIAELPSESPLRRELLSGARGTGVHQPWMDDMRTQGVKRAVVEIEIHFDRRGRAKRMVVNGIQFFTGYDGGRPISDGEKLNKIRANGLAQTLGDLALKRAAHGAWTDVPRPKPEPFDGGARLEFFDDEWLPTTSVPLYCAGTHCVSGL